MDKEKSANDYETELQIRAKDAKVVRKVVFFVIAFSVLFFVITGFMAYSYVKSALGAVDPDSEAEVEIEIPLGSTSGDIARILYDHNLIKDERFFKLYVKLKNEVDFQAGQYTLSPAMTLPETIAELKQGKLIEEPLFRITIPEGKTIEQMAPIFASKLKFSEEDFLAAVQDEALIEQLMEQFPTLLTDEIKNKEIYEPLEGYLFAGTYDIFDEEISAKEIVTLMVERTNDIFEDRIELVEESGFTIHEILTLASIIERESKFSEDRPKVSQVYLNRLEKKMPLQSDITAFYGLQHKAVVTYDDLKVDTPYNTYVIDGLPVGPISSPSIEAIDAVLEPEGEDFTKLYYFSRPNGETFYSDTLEEHNRIKEKYRHEWYELENQSETEEENE